VSQPEHDPSAVPADDPFAFAARYNIPITADLNRNFDWHPRLTVANQLVAKPDTNVQYYFSQLDYLIGDDNVQANRMIAAIPQGSRTELMYWTAQAACNKQLTVHQGRGGIVLAQLNGEGESLVSHRLLEPDTPQNRERTIAPRSFYCLHGVLGVLAVEPLVVSGFYQTPITSWEGLEVEVEVGQRRIAAPEGEVEVPHKLIRILQRPL